MAEIRSRPSRFLGSMVVLALGGACATPHATAPRGPPPWVDEGISQGLQVEDPLALGPAAREQIRANVAGGASERGRMRKLLRYLVDEDGLGFRYLPSLTLGADAAFTQRQGNCMSYAMLYVAGARSVGVNVRFVRITQLPVYWQDNGQFFTSSHIAVAFGAETGPDEEMVVDFSATHTSDWRVALYDELDDATAYALFHSNRAVELLLAGQVGEAEQLLRFLVDHAPPVAEVYNNLGIVLIHQNRADEATAVYERAIPRFPRFRPLYSNAVQAALLAGRTELVERWRAAGEEIARSDPAFNFSEGMVAYRRKDYAAAAERFEQALAIHPDDLTLLTWAARSQFAAGETRRGQRHVDRIRSQKPSEARRSVLGALQKEFPDAVIELSEAPSLARS